MDNELCIKNLQRAIDELKECDKDDGPLTYKGPLYRLDPEVVKKHPDAQWRLVTEGVEQDG